MTRPTWLIGAATLAAVLLTARLGFWQLDRAAQKEARQAEIVERGRLPALSARELARSPAEAEAQRSRRAAVTGRWLGERTIYLGNRRMQGRVGFHVFTPLALDDGSGAVLMVQRGFVPRRVDDPVAVPPVPAPGGTVRVQGTLTGSPARLWQFSAEASGPIRQNLDLDAHARETGLPLLPVTLVESPQGAPADGLGRQWPEPVADVSRHHGYAFQWFMLAATIVVLHVWFRYVQPRRRARR